MHENRTLILTLILSLLWIVLAVAIELKCGQHKDSPYLPTERMLYEDYVDTFIAD